MRIPLNIFLKSYVAYVVLTLPAIFMPYMYFISAVYAFIYGLIAFVVFAVSWFFLDTYHLHHTVRMTGLLIAVPASVAVAFQMIEFTGAWDDVWHSGGFLLFPMAAVIAGWIGVFLCGKQIAGIVDQGESAE